MTGFKKKKAINKGPDYLKGIIRQICEVVLIPSGLFYDQIQLSQVKRNKGICFKMIEKENIQQIWKERKVVNEYSLLTQTT